VRPFETFDAVGAGVADMYHSTEYYWEKKSPAFNFFAAVPFGFTADELFAWVHYGVIEAVTAGEYARSLAEFNANNALWLRKPRDEGTVKILKFDDILLKAFLEISKVVVAEAGSRDDLSKKIYQSYEQFRASIMDWSDIAERAFLNSRRLA
jgi:TRAP-type mannitol/chloroaromatic compound transport system substrate-binding protein